MKVIDLSVNGNEYDKKDFLIIIKEELKRIHSSTFNNLEVNEMVPCVCKECISNQAPNFFDNKDLEKYRTNNVHTIRCNKSSCLEEVDVNRLIEGYEDISEIREKESEDNFLPQPQQSPVIPVVKSPEKKPWYEKWHYILGLVGTMVLITWYSMQIIKSCATKETGQNNAVPLKSIEQVKQDSTKNVIKDSNANKQKINTKK